VSDGVLGLRDVACRVAPHRARWASSSRFTSPVSSAVARARRRLSDRTPPPGRAAGPRARPCPERCPEPPTSEHGLL